MFYFEFTNGKTVLLKSMGHALEYAHINNCRIIRSSEKVL